LGGNKLAKKGEHTGAQNQGNQTQGRLLAKKVASTVGGPKRKECNGGFSEKETGKNVRGEPDSATETGELGVKREDRGTDVPFCQKLA